MLAMSDINCIKHLRNTKGLSISEIQKTLGINWRTAKKYADEDQLPIEQQKKKTGMMYEEKWGEIVSGWLFEDRRLKRKLRRNKKQIFEELKTHGFPGSYRTVCYFIDDWRHGHSTEDSPDKGYERLEHPPGEAQVDFGTMETVQDGEFVDVHTLIMSFPYSNAAVAVPLPGENQECFLHGLKVLFHQCGGVPKQIRIDNLTPAVKKTRSRFGEAELTDAFIQFQNHYGFEVQVCNPRSGHEKGSVENKVGYVRYNFFSASPVMESFEHLTDMLQTQLVKDRGRLHYEKNVPIERLWNDEQRHLLHLPTTDYPVFRTIEGRINKYNEVTLDQTRIHIPRAANHPRLRLVLTWDRYKAITDDGEILADDHRPYMNRRRAIPWQTVVKGWIHKPRVIAYSRYTKYLPGRVKDYLLVEDIQLRKARLNTLANLLVTHDMKQINQEFYDILSTAEEDPYGVDWTHYDALAPAQTGGGTS